MHVLDSTAALGEKARSFEALRPGGCPSEVPLGGQKSLRRKVNGLWIQWFEVLPSLEGQEEARLGVVTARAGAGY